MGSPAGGSYGAKSMRITGSLSTECPDCRGVGYTTNTAAEMHTLWNDERGEHVEHFTMYRDAVPQLGSGCPRCLGLGQLHARV
jgi:hypothetical protein